MHACVCTARAAWYAVQRGIPFVMVSKRHNIPRGVVSDRRGNRARACARSSSIDVQRFLCVMSRRALIACRRCGSDHGWARAARSAETPSAVSLSSVWRSEWLHRCMPRVMVHAQPRCTPRHSHSGTLAGMCARSLSRARHAHHDELVDARELLDVRTRVRLDVEFVVDHSA